MASGKVKWYSAQKGYGFIQPASGGSDIFVHVSALDASGVKDLSEGQEVTYEVEKDRKGRPSATNLKV